MAILHERGRFWWNEERVDDNFFAPQSAISGLLIVEAGKIELELDGIIPSDKGPFAALFGNAGVSTGKVIQGVLSQSGKRVLLADLIGNGGQLRTAGPSTQKFLAFDCLVSDRPFPAGELPAINSMIVNLKGLEEWLRLNSVKVKKTKNTTTVQYRRPKTASYRFGSEKLSIEFKIDGKQQSRSASLDEQAVLIHSTGQPTQLTTQRQIFGLLSDLFILLTGSNFSLDWPTLQLEDGQRCNWYFLRNSPEKETSIGWHECWTNFPELRSSFGKIWSRWKELHEQSGPAVYLYLGTMRGMSLYPEHRFVNLIWGIEAFHRKRNSSEPAVAFTKKVERILSQIKLNKDAKWLKGKLRHAHEPSLAERIATILNSLPMNLEPTLVSKFATKCADLRNEISHFGGNKSGAPYVEFATELGKYSRTLAVLYQYLLLFEIGIDPEKLNWWINDGFRSYIIKKGFVEVGLMREAESAK